MKRIMKLMTLVAVAAAGLTACQNNFEEITNEDIARSVVVKFESEEATRTSVDTSGDEPLFSWNEAESFVALEQTDALAEATSVNYKLVDGKAHIDAEFALNGGKDEYRYAVVYPASGYVAAESINSVTLALPAEQTMAEQSYDPNADLMVSLPVTTDAQPTETQLLRFTRLAAVAKMSISNLSLGADETVEKVVFTADGKTIAGNIIADLDDPHAASVGEGVSSIAVATTSAKDVYFTLLPTTLNAEDIYSVVVETSKQIYIKQGAIPADKSLAFEAGKVTRIGVNMTDALSGAKWVLVRDASTLKQGDVVTIAAKNYNYVIGKPSSSVYPLASQTEAIKVGDYLYHNPVDTSADHMMQTYTLMKRDENRNAFDFYNDVDFEGDTYVGFAWANGSNNTPKLQAFCDKNTLFDVSIADGIATITASEISGSYKYWRYYHANYATSRKFDLTSSEVTNDANKIHLYRLEGAVGEIPTVAAVVTVPDSDEVVTIAEEGTSEATTIEDVVFNYVGSWTISVSDNAEWLDLAYDAAKSALTYTAEANVGAKREATATITASLEGEESLSWSFNIVQKGAPQEITIAEFMTKEKDENATYKITGRVTEVTSSSSGTYKLSDNNGNIATVTYVYTDAGDKVYGDNSIGVKVGDVMTVTTVVTSTTKGKGGSSTYHTIYKGHYGFSASAGIAADYTGGSVAIEVDTYSNGDIVVPEAVVATMADNDYAKFEYDGGNSATVTFDSENTTTDAREAVVTFTYGMTDVVVVAEQGINPANKRGYELVTDASTLAVGDEVIIVAKNADRALACPTKTSDTKFPSAVIEKTGNVIYDIEDAGVQTFTLMSGNSDGTMSFEFTYNNTVYYPYYSSGLKMRTSINDAASWTIKINEDGEAFISTIYSSSTYLIKFNSATSSLTFTCYKDSVANATKAENAVAIYKKQL
ncbi:MAG: hypothetical protein IKK05_00785 [Alistipes sp.]|nr:hypothetical protein [Alistipes sp.]